MHTDPVEAGRTSGEGESPGQEHGQKRAQTQLDPPPPDQTQLDPPRLRWWRRWRTWLPFVIKPLRRGIVLILVALFIE
jgi:hypothetical protein